MDDTLETINMRTEGRFFFLDGDDNVVERAAAGRGGDVVLFVNRAERAEAAYVRWRRSVRWEVSEW